jgi:UDPglucose--hexose-1-phosphate uridylyltransferase
VIYAAHRQERTFMPAASSDPLLPTADPARPTELPSGDYEVAVFENRFPSLVEEAGVLTSISGAQIEPAYGRCEVVAFCQSPDVSLWQLSVGYIALIMDVWADRTRDMVQAGISYILPFENRGAEMGVTLHHPHSQIYGYGFVPSLVARAVAAQRDYMSETGRNLVGALAAEERALGIRVIATRQHALAFVPPFARYPYETWIIPMRPGADLLTLAPSEKMDVASLLAEVLQRLDRLWDMPMPYLLTLNQAPFDNRDHPEWTLRIEIWPVRRSRDKLKFLAGTELAADVFASDVLPEAAAAQLRSVQL